jgi:hypothetical protein
MAVLVLGASPLEMGILAAAGQAPFLLAVSEVARLAREGPPDEAVGLEPYGPSEAMPA